MTSAEIAIREQHDTDSWVAMLPAVGELAREVYQTEFVPGALRGKPPAVIAAILAGRELNLPPMQSLQHIHVIDGRPTLSAQMQRSLALSAGYHINVIETNTTRCIVEGRRSARDEWTRVAWTLDDAKKAGLLGRQNWQKHPRRMLQARATAELCQLIFSDAIAGMAATEEIEDDAEGPGAVMVPAANGQPPKAAARTARRRQAPEPEPDPTAPAAGSGQSTGSSTAPAAASPSPTGGTDLPPLPGEDEPAADAPDETDYDSPGTVTRDQLTAMWATFTADLGFTKDNKAEARAVCEKITGRKLKGGTTSDLSRNEASACIDTLKLVKTRERLIVLMNDGELPDGGETAGGESNG